MEAFPLVLCNLAEKILEQEFQSKVWGVIINNFTDSHNGSDCPASTGLSVLTWHALCSSHKSETAPYIRSWWTEIIVLKTISIFPPSAQKWIIFHLLCFSAFVGTMDSWIEKLGVRFLRILASSIPRLCPILLVVCNHEQNTTSFLIQVRGTTIFLMKIFSHNRNEIRVRFASLFIVLRSPWDVVEHRHEDDPSCKFFWLYAHFKQELLDFVAELQCGESWKIFHSNSIGSPSIASKDLYCGELLNHVNLSSQKVFDCGFWCAFPRHNTESENT